MIPSYLAPMAEADYYYGDLAYQKKENRWVITGEPCVIELAKRLFPGCDGRRSGEAFFSNTKRIIGDLNWLMLRYPLRITDPDRWNRIYHDAVDHVTRSRELLHKPRKTVPPMDFIGELKEYQKEGLGFLLHYRRTLLADDMGLGKTPQALAFLSATKTYPALVVVPPHLIINWKVEIDKFLRLPSKIMPLFADYKNDSSAVHVIRGLKPYRLPKDTSIIIIHYLLLRGWKEVLPEYGFRTVLFDEIQELRHDKTEKYSAASLVSSAAENVIGMSGTPMYNYGIEMWNVLNVIEFHCLGDKEAFTREWCAGYGSDKISKPELFGEYLRREGLMIRRLKKDVLSELPPKRRVIQAIDFDESQYSELIQGAISKAKELQNANGWSQRGQITSYIERETRQAIGIAKAPFVTDFVAMLLESGERVLLFAYHHSVWNLYKAHLTKYHPVFITGRETPAEKNRAIEAFKNEQTDVCCVSLRSAQGLNGLESATCGVFGELDWSPAIHSQAEDRLQRIGCDETADSFLFYYLVANEGTDEAIQEVLGLKVAQFMGIMGENPESETDRLMSQQKAEDHMDKVIKRLIEQGASQKGK
jgi:SWI/SNF-related matrix-associated actin-dependent regulator 1 of chromatin subfamily A